MEVEFLGPGAIVARTLGQFLPVWIAMAVIMVLFPSAHAKQRGADGQLGSFLPGP